MAYYFNSNISQIFEKTALWLFPHNLNRNGELLKLLLSVIGGLGVLYSLHLASRRLKATNVGLELQAKAINNQSDQLELTRKGQVDERFKNAVEHLGIDKEPIVLGGIVELHQIAKENKEKYAAVVFNILTSYLRSILRNKIPLNNNFSETIPQTIVDFIFRGNDLYLYEGLVANLSHCNFSSIDINGAHFFSSDFSFAIMPMQITGVRFENSNFSRTNFTIGQIENVNFKNSEFHDCLFNLCEIKNSDFSETQFFTSIFRNSKVCNCNFLKSSLFNTKFLLSHFENSKFTCAELIQIKYWGSNLIKVDFSENDTMSRVEFIGSGFHETTFDSKCLQCDFSGIGPRFQFDFIQLKDLEKNIGKPVSKNGIIELSNNYFLVLL